VGSVHCVRDRMLLRQVALKILDRCWRNPVQVERFVNEAQINAQLEHPNIVPVHEIVLAPDGPKYFTMKLVEGSTCTTGSQRREDRPARSRPSTR
jgi:serine/threonine-protein kinase